MCSWQININRSKILHSKYLDSYCKTVFILSSCDQSVSVHRDSLRHSVQNW